MNLPEGYVFVDCCLIYATTARMSINRILSPTVHIIFATDSLVQKTVSFYCYVPLIRGALLSLR